MMTMPALYDIINILPLSLLSVMLLGGYAGIPEKSAAAVIFCLLFTVWLTALKNMKLKNRLRNVGLVLVFILGLWLAVGEESRDIFFEKHLWVAWVFGFSAGAVVIGLILYRSIWLRRAAALALLGWCIVMTVFGRDIGKGAFALICFFLLIRASEEIQRRWPKSGSPEMEGHITRTAPFIAALCLIVYFTPAPDKPFSWQFVKDIYYRTASFIGRIFGTFTERSDDYGSMGFSEEGGFLSKLGSNDDEVMYITVLGSSSGEYRLVGCISGDFDGREWVFGGEPGNELRTMDSVETFAAVSKYSVSERTDLIMRVDMDNEMGYYSTRYIFAPSKIKSETTKGNGFNISENGLSIISDKWLGYKDTYRVSCYELNFRNPKLPELLENAAPLNEAEWKQSAAMVGSPGISFEEYQSYRSKVYENFCRSRGVSEEVEKILAAIRSEASGRYEAAKMLETFLRQMEYSTDCGPLPDTVTDAASFLDYFLLTSQKGYCMHYSTAFVLMANELGIPCRHVQGYYVKKSFGGRVTVMEKNAHAWPEVYFDNVGWVAFEPTPGFSVSSGWALDDILLSDLESSPPEPEITINIPEPVVLPEVTEEEQAGLDPLIFIIPTLAVIGFLLMFYAVSRFLNARKYRQMGTTEKFKFLAGQDIRLIGYLGISPGEGETLSEYAERITASDEEGLTERIGFIQLYEAVLYSDRGVTSDELSAAEENTRALRELVKKRSLRLRVMLIVRGR